MSRPRKRNRMGALEAPCKPAIGGRQVVVDDRRMPETGSPRPPKGGLGEALLGFGSATKLADNRHRQMTRRAARNFIAHASKTSNGWDIRHGTERSISTPVAEARELSLSPTLARGRSWTLCRRNGSWKQEE
jgi:hypothetical protein